MTREDDPPKPPRPIPLPKYGPSSIAAFQAVLARSLPGHLLKPSTKWPKLLVRKLDAWASDQGMDRSEVIRRLVELGLRAKA